MFRRGRYASHGARLCGKRPVSAAVFAYSSNVPRAPAPKSRSSPCNRLCCRRIRRAWCASASPASVVPRAASFEQNDTSIRFDITDALACRGQCEIRLSGPGRNAAGIHQTKEQVRAIVFHAVTMIDGLRTIRTMSPLTAAAILIIPSFVTNVWQMLAGRDILRLMRRLWAMMLCFVIGQWL
jgi:hypothetical protein